MAKIGASEPTYKSSLVLTVHKLRRKPLEEYTIENLRVMIGQQVGLDYLMPLAIEKLTDNPMASGKYYPGDLLQSVLSVVPSFWKTHPDLYADVESVLDKVVKLINEPTEEDYQTIKDLLAKGLGIFNASENVETNRQQ